jgi:DNA-directed RNA polymerase specialized sigma24 family protein
VSLTEALRAGAPQAFGALYDEHAGPLYAYCYVMVGDEAGDALRDVFVTVARHPDAVPGDDAELPAWLHSLARTECVRRGAFLRGVVATPSADPLRRALALLSPEDREVLALSNALDTAETARVLGVAWDAAELLVREAQWRLQQAAASVSDREPRDSATLAPLSGAALHRLVTLGYEPPAGQRERVLSSCAAAGRARGGTAVFGADGTPLPPDAFSAQADDATHQFSTISPDDPATAPLRLDGIPANARPDQPGSDRPPPAEFPGAAPAGLESVGVGPAGHSAHADEQPPPGRGTHAKRRKPVVGRRVIPVVGLVACVAAATGVALALSGSNDADRTSAIVHQSVRPSRSVQPSPSGDQTTPPPREASSDPDTSTAPTGRSAAPTATKSPSSRASADAPDPATPTPTAEPTTTPTARHTPTPKPTPTHHRTPTAEPTSPDEPRPETPTTKPRPHHTAGPGDLFGTPSRRDGDPRATWRPGPRW